MSDKRRRPEHDKFSSPDYERQQQRQRTDGDPAAKLKPSLLARLSWDTTDDQQEQQQQNGSGGTANKNDSRSSSAAGRARIEFNLEKSRAAAAAAAADDIKPRASSKYNTGGSGGKDSGERAAAAAADAADPPVLKRLSYNQSAADRDRDRDNRDSRAAGGRDGGSSRRLLSPAHRDRDRERERDVSARRAAPPPAAARPRDSSREMSRPRSRGGVAAAAAAAEQHRSPDRSRERSRPGSAGREREREPSSRQQRDGDGGPPHRDASLPAPSNNKQQQRPAGGLRDTRGSDGFARPQPRFPAQQQRQQQQPRQPQVPLKPGQQLQLPDAAQADAVMSGVRARQAVLVEQQLSHLILTQALASEEVWAQACKAANIPAELVDGPLVAMARRSDCDHALTSRAAAHIMPPPRPLLDSDHSGNSQHHHDSGSGSVGVVSEDVYIQQLQALINRYEQQSAAPYCAEVWALNAAGSRGKQGGGGGGRAGQQQQEQEDAAGAGAEGVSYSLLLPAELRGLLWDV